MADHCHRRAILATQDHASRDGPQPFGEDVSEESAVGVDASISSDREVAGGVICPLRAGERYQVLKGSLRSDRCVAVRAGAGGGAITSNRRSRVRRRWVLPYPRASAVTFSCPSRWGAADPLGPQQRVERTA